MLRKITNTDKEIYFEMSRTFYSCGAALKPISDEKRENFWKTIVEDIYVNGYIIECDGRVAGYAITVPYASQESGGVVLWVDELFVKPEFRGRGLAKEFFAYISASADKTALRLEAEPNNQKAIRLYESIGFRHLPYIQMIKYNEE